MQLIGSGKVEETTRELQLAGEVRSDALNLGDDWIKGRLCCVLKRLANLIHWRHLHCNKRVANGVGGDSGRRGLNDAMND